MDYGTTQSLANDLLSGSHEAFSLEFDDAIPQNVDSEAQRQLLAPGLWSDSDTASDSSDNDEQNDKSGNKKRPGKGRAAAHKELAFGVQRMLSRANELFANKKLDEAEELLKEVIRIDPEVREAYQTLGEIYEDRGDLLKCVSSWDLALRLGPKDADMCRSNARLKQELGLIDEADNLYRQLIQLRPQDPDALWERAVLNRDNNRPNEAIKVFQQVLRLLPFEMLAVRELARLFVQCDRQADAAVLYEETADHCMNSTSASGQPFSWSELNIMAEFCMAVAELRGRSEDWRRAISRIKIVARWLHGRQSELWWDEHNNDAEWDQDDKRRKLEPRYSGPPVADAYYLPIELRIKLGRARLKLKDQEEALRHFEFLDDHHTLEDPDLVMEVADALLKSGAWEEALEFYTRLADHDVFQTPELWLGMGKAYKAIGEFAQAEDYFDAVLANDPKSTDTMVLLAEVYESTDRREKALEIINAIIELRNSADIAEANLDSEGHRWGSGDENSGKTYNHNDSKGPSRPKKRRRFVGRKQEGLVEFEGRKTQETKTRFKVLELSQDGMLRQEVQATGQWMSAASDLVDEFRNIRHFYPADKKNTYQGIIRSRSRFQNANSTSKEQLQGMADRLEDSITAGDIMSKTDVNLDSFRGFSFEEWLDVFLQYALLLVQAGDFDAGYSVLDAAVNANVFYQNHDRFMRIQIMKMIMTLSANKSKIGAEQARWILLHCLFREDGIRFYGTVLASGSSATKEYNDNANQKFMLRLVKTMDSLLSGESINGTNSVREIDNSPESVRPQAPQAHLLMLYGQMIAVGRGYTAALHYFVRTLYESPSDPLLVFSMGLAYLHKSMQRQSDNRHWQILQAVSFFLEYNELRRRDGDPGHLQEIQYNIGRACHQLGLLHLAVSFYEEVLKIKRVEPKYDLSANAAYNLQLIHMLANNPARAREIGEEYLTI